MDEALRVKVRTNGRDKSGREGLRAKGRSEVAVVQAWNGSKEQSVR